MSVACAFTSTQVNRTSLFAKRRNSGAMSDFRINIANCRTCSDEVAVGSNASYSPFVGLKYPERGVGTISATYIYKQK